MEGEQWARGLHIIEVSSTLQSAHTCRSPPVSAHLHVCIVIVCAFNYTILTALVALLGDKRRNRANTLEDTAQLRQTVFALRRRRRHQIVARPGGVSAVALRQGKVAPKTVFS